MKLSTGCIFLSFSIALGETWADNNGSTTIRLHKVPDEDYFQSLLQISEAHFRDGNESSLTLSSKLYRQKIGRYYLGFGIGSPPQFFRMIFDTTSSNVIVPTVGCRNCGNRFIDYKNKYDSSASETYQSDGDRFHISYPLWLDNPAGPVNVGYFSVDDVLLGIDVTIQSQRFAEIQDAAGLGLNYIFDEYDGIMGLGFTALSVDDTPTMMDNAISQNNNNMKHPIFAINADIYDNGGELRFGNYDPTKFTGKLVTIPLVRAAYWEIAIDSVSAGNVRIPYSTTGMNTTSSMGSRDEKPRHKEDLVTAIIDSTTALIFGPIADVAQVAEAVGATKQFLGFYRLEHCDDVDSMPEVVFTINGVPFSIPGPSLIFKVFHYCLLAVLPIVLPDSSPDWILGDFFMRQFYMVFNVKHETISMAKAIQQGTDSVVVLDK